MNNFTHYIPTKIYFGKNQIEHLSELADYGKKVLIVGYSKGEGVVIDIYKRAVDILKRAGVEPFDLEDVAPNPKIESVRKGVEICKNNNIDMVLAIGGGSCIDCAKNIAAGAKYDGDAWDLIVDTKKIKSALPIFCVSTIAATGSEMDGDAVISDMEKNEKWSATSSYFQPTMSICDPEYTFTVNAYHTAAGTADIMSHVFESYFTRVKDGYFQARLCEAILKTCIKYGPIALNEPDNYSARANLMWVSNWAMNGLLWEGAEVRWGLHAVEHELSAFYDITHGAGLAILTPYWMEYVLNDETKPKFAEYGINVWGIDDSQPEIEIAKQAIYCTRKFFTDDLHLPARLSEVGINEDKHFSTMAEKAAGIIEGCYVPLKKDDIINILKAAT